MSKHKERDPSVPAAAYFVAGGFSGAVSKTCIAPYERARILLQVGKKSSPSVVFKDIYIKDGVAGFFKGNLVNCGRQFLNKGFLFAFNDVFKSASQFIRTSFKESGHTYLSWIPVFLSGSMAGLCMQMLTYPVDVIRVRFSAQLGQTQYTGFFKTLMATVSLEGLTALYRGAAPTLCGAIIYEGIKFGVFDLYLERTRPLSERLNVSLTPVAGALAGLTAVLVTHPNDTVRRRMQMQGLGGQKKHYSSTPNAYLTILRVEGPRAFWRGLATSVYGKVPSIAIQFTIYNGIKKGLISQR